MQSKVEKCGLKIGSGGRGNEWRISDFQFVLIC